VFGESEEKRGILGHSEINQLFINRYGLQHLLGTESGAEFVRKIKGRVSKGEDVDCSKEVPDCDFSDEQGN